MHPDSHCFCISPALAVLFTILRCILDRGAPRAKAWPNHGVEQERQVTKSPSRATDDFVKGIDRNHGKTGSPQGAFQAGFPDASRMIAVDEPSSATAPKSARVCPFLS